jgi:Flp pilus assembly secretin CpaC
MHSLCLPEGIPQRKAIIMTFGPFFKFSKIALLGAALIIGLSTLSAHAEEPKQAVVDIIPAHTATGEGTNAPFKDDEATHPILRVTTDKSEIITLDRDAASVIVGNPLHANVMADSVRKLVVIPRAPGATYFTVLDTDGNVIMQRHVIVGSPKEGYVRVKKVCNKDSGEGCKNTNVFYCPDMCHEIGSTTEQDSSSSSSSADDKKSATDSAAEEGNSDQEGTTEE